MPSPLRKKGGVWPVVSVGRLHRARRWRGTKQSKPPSSNTSAENSPGNGKRFLVAAPGCRRKYAKSDSARSSGAGHSSAAGEKFSIMGLLGLCASLSTERWCLFLDFEAGGPAKVAGFALSNYPAAALAGRRAGLHGLQRDSAHARPASRSYSGRGPHHLAIGGPKP